MTNPQSFYEKLFSKNKKAKEGEVSFVVFLCLLSNKSSLLLLEKAKQVKTYIIILPRKSDGVVEISNGDTNQLDKQMTKDTTNSSQLGLSSRHAKQGPAKSHKSLSRGRTRHEPK